MKAQNMCDACLCQEVGAEAQDLTVAGETAHDGGAVLRLGGLVG